MFFQDNKIIEITYRNLEDEIVTEHEYVTETCDVNDIIYGYESIGCEVLEWRWW